MIFLRCTGPVQITDDRHARLYNTALNMHILHSQWRFTFHFRILSPSWYFYFGQLSAQVGVLYRSDNGNNVAIRKGCREQNVSFREMF